MITSGHLSQRERGIKNNSLEPSPVASTRHPLPEGEEDKE